MAAVKSSLKAGLHLAKKILVDESRCIGFMGKEGMVYATPKMVSDVEYACRDWLLEHLDQGEDSVGAHVSIDHLAATPLGLQVSIEAKVVEVDRRKVTFEFTVTDPATYTAPWTVRVDMHRTTAIYEYACHEGNYALSNILSAARAKERTAAKPEITR